MSFLGGGRGPKTKAMRVVEERTGQPLEKLLPAMLRRMKQKDVAAELGVRSGAITEWCYRLRIGSVARGITLEQSAADADVITEYLAAIDRLGMQPPAAVRRALEAAMEGASS